MASKAGSKAADAMSKLSLNSSEPKAASATTKQPAVADSWEDESSSEDGDGGTSTPTNRTSTPSSSASGFIAPPPTPASPTYSTGAPWQSMTAPDSPGAAAKRPEKTDAVARRMIASALGVKAPKLTDEQRAYERAVRDKERRKRELEKEEERKMQAEADRAKAAMWED